MHWNTSIKDIGPGRVQFFCACCIGTGRKRGSNERWALVPRLGRTEGGGTGRLSRYRIEWVEQSAAPESDRVEDLREALPIASLDIRYISEDVENPGMLASVFAKGFFLVGWRRWAFIVVVGASVLLLLGVFSLVLFQLVLRKGLGVTPAANNLVAGLVLLAVFFPTLGALFIAAERKIVVAPWWMQSLHEDRLLEHRSPPRFPVKHLKIARYTAVCPICEGSVTARSGGWEFFGRIIGRCENSPQEHIYSFDHVTRRGKSLR